MFLSLGPDVLKLDGTRHDAEMMEASGHAASRWARLLDLEAQLQRDDAVLASRPKKGPAAPATTFYPTARSKSATGHGNRRRRSGAKGSPR